MPIPPNYPVVGADAFRTATGVHAAAVVKAFRKGDRALMDAVYAAVPASLVGREQEIEVGPMSGTIERHLLAGEPRLPATDEIVDRVFAAAKASNRTLTLEQVQKILDEAALEAVHPKARTETRDTKRRSHGHELLFDQRARRSRASSGGGRTRIRSYRAMVRLRSFGVSSGPIAAARRWAGAGHGRFGRHPVIPSCPSYLRVGSLRK